MNISGDDFVSLQLPDPRIEGSHRVPEAEESTLLALVHVFYLFLAGVDQRVHEPPGGYVVELCLHEPFLPDDLRPQSLLPGHGLLELEALVLPIVSGPLHLEMVCQHRPQVLPLVDVPVGAVERFVLAAGLESRPERVLGDELRVGGVAESLPGDEGAGPAQRGALLAADCGVDAEAGDDVALTARGEAEEGGGAVHRPGDGAGGAVEPGMRDLVEEDVLEVGVLEVRDVLWVRAHRHNGGKESRHGFERVDESLAAGLEADVDERGASGDDDGEDVAEHGAAGLAGVVLSRTGARGPGGVEYVGDVGEGLEGLGHGGGVGEVEVEVDDGVGIGGGGGARWRGPGRERAAGERVDLPWPHGGVQAREDVEEGGADDARGADDEGHLLGRGRGPRPRPPRAPRCGASRSCRTLQSSTTASWWAGGRR
jgi:hypothetical protein